MTTLYHAAASPIQTVSEDYQTFGLGSLFLAPKNNVNMQHCALIDLTNLSRVGFRGADSAQFLHQAGFVLPEHANTLIQQVDGSVVGRLSATEYLVLGTLHDFGASIHDLEQNWQFTDTANYLLPRQDSHVWIQLTGEHIASVMAKLCAVDLSEQAFKVGQIAQTSVARINAIILNVSDADTAKFNILCDRAAGLYLWQVLLDAMTEFNGQTIGISI